MISYERFRQEVMNRIKSYLPESYAGWKLRMETEYKINQILDCLTLYPPGNLKLTAVPQFYLQEYYQLYLKGVSADFILRMIASRIENVPSPEEVEQSGFDILKFQDSVVMQLVHRFRNHVFLKSVPHRPFLDLAVIYRIMVFDEKGKWAGAVINHTMLNAMGISEEKLFERAYRHTPEALPFQLTDTRELLPCKGICREDCTADCGENCCKVLQKYADTGEDGKNTFACILREQKTKMLMLSNESEQFGAAAMLYPEQLNAACDKLDGSIYILPGSMHELYLVREEPEKLGFYRKLVMHAGSDVVDETDWLSEQVYRYNPKTGKVRVAL
ncbi:MAG: DUF5688 family protein [Anaerovoracaceae bacterium]